MKEFASYTSFFEQQIFSRLVEICLQVRLRNHARIGLTTFRATIFASMAKRNIFSQEMVFFLADFLYLYDDFKIELKVNHSSSGPPKVSKRGVVI